MTRTEKTLANAEAQGRMMAKVEAGQIAANGVTYRPFNKWRGIFAEAWQRGYDSYAK